MSNEIRVIVIDDHPLLRRGLLQVIESSPGLKVVAEAGDGEAALARIEELQPDIAAELFIHYRTVENHRTSICQKLGLHGHNALFKFALQHKSEL